MTAIIAALPAFLAALPVAISGIQSIIAMIESIRTAALATKEWTPEADAAYHAWLVGTLTDPAWKTDKELEADQQKPV